MAAGQQDKYSVGFIIQARMGSSRMPGKVLLNIPLDSKKTVLERIIDELKESRYGGKIIVATTIEPEDDAIESFCNRQGTDCKRGSKDDVLSRFLSVIGEHTFGAIVRITADNPLIDHNLIDELIAHHFHNNNDYTVSAGLPIGMNMEIVRPAVLQQLADTALTDSEKEHVTIALKKNKTVQTEIVQMGEPGLASLRLTLDYSLDYLVLSAVIAATEATGVKGLAGIKETLHTYAWLFEANAECIQQNS